MTSHELTLKIKLQISIFTHRINYIINYRAYKTKIIFYILNLQKHDFIIFFFIIDLIRKLGRLAVGFFFCLFVGMLVGGNG